MDEKKKELIRTSMHIRSDNLAKIGMLKACYTYKTKEIISRQNFIELMIKAAEEKIEAMPTAEVVDGKIVYKTEE